MLQIVRVCEIEIKNERNSVKISIRKQEIEKNDRKMTKRRKRKGEEEKKYSVFCQKFILPV